MDEIKANAVSNSGKGVEKMYAYIQETKQQTLKGERKLHCVCLHQKNKQPSLKRTNRSDKDGNPIWVCRRCGGEINLQQMKIEDLENAIAIVSRAIDIIKILSNPANDKDAEFLKKMSKEQYRLEDVKKAFVTVTTGGKKKRNNSQQSGPRGSTWKG